MALAQPVYRPRDAEHSVLHAVIRERLEDFLREAAARGEGAGLPRFIEREFREFLTCGVLAHGFARVRCDSCAFERLVPFSCKGRGFCPSCGGRRMTERAAHLVDHVLPRVPVRQWVLTVPYRLRYLLAWDHGLSRAVLDVYARALLGFYSRSARQSGIRRGRTGTLTVIQRFGSGLNLNVHFHTLALDGVFSEDPPGGLEFHPAPPPSDEEVARVLATIRRGVRRLLARRGLEPGDEATGSPDRLAEESLSLSGIVSASVQGRVALGPRAGARVRRLGREPDPEGVTSRGPRQAHLDGFDLHANVRVPANDRARLEGLCRYVLRPPLAQDRLRLRADGRVLVKLKTAWHDGTSHLLFEPIEFLEKLAALTPRPEVNLLIYHGVLAPHAQWRRHVVAYGREATEDPDARTAGAGSAGTGPASNGRYWAWAALMRRAFEIDVLACPRCGGRLRLIATIDDPRVIRRILAHLGLPIEAPSPDPSRPPPGPTADLFCDTAA
ncbi:MAG: transposase [Candidatus Rokubacteria bacterium]|nr:transposase [Candidatus Rokubacteria bacterium]